MFGPQEACCHGAIVGFDLSHSPARKLLAAWLSCALHRECIAPVGSHRGNHRQDQAELTVIMLNHGLNPGPGPRHHLWVQLDNQWD